MPSNLTQGHVTLESSDGTILPACVPVCFCCHIYQDIASSVPIDITFMDPSAMHHHWGHNNNGNANAEAAAGETKDKKDKKMRQTGRHTRHTIQSLEMEEIEGRREGGKENGEGERG